MLSPVAFSDAAEAQQAVTWWPVFWVLRFVCGDSTQICQQKQCQPSNAEEKQQLGKWRFLVFSVYQLCYEFKAENVVGFLVFSQHALHRSSEAGLLRKRAEGF